MYVDDIKTIQEVASKVTPELTQQWMHDNQEMVNAKMDELKQQELEETNAFLAELPDEVREEIIMFLQ